MNDSIEIREDKKFISTNIKLWNPTYFVILGMFFTYLPVAILYSINYGRLGYKSKMVSRLVIALIIYTTLQGLLYYELLWTSVIYGFSLLLSCYMFKDQKALYEDYIDNGGRSASYFVPVLICIILQTLYLAVLILNISTENAPFTFKEYRSEKGHFIVNFPGTPEEKIQKVNMGDDTVDMYTYVVYKSNKIFQVIYADTKDSEEEINCTPEVMLEEICQGLVKNDELLSESIIECDSYPGREIYYKILDTELFVKHRIYLVKNRLYQVMVSTEVDNNFSEETTTFMDSFKFIE